MKNQRKNNIIIAVSILLIVLAIALFAGIYFGSGFKSDGFLPSFDDSLNENEDNSFVDDGTDKQITYKEENEKVSAKFTYEDLNKANYYPVVPSLGEVNIIVVPVEFETKFSVEYRTEPFEETDLRNIDLAFNGDENGKNPYWESVSSFYNKSSYGNLNFHFEVTDPFKPTLTSTEFKNYETDQYSGIGGSTAVLTEIFQNGLTINGESLDLLSDKFDANNDGFIDGIWLIYNASYANLTSEASFWAYTTNYYPQYDPTITNLAGYQNLDKYVTRYANCGLYFLSQGYGSQGSDAHTLIHETGHMLGLDDYYTYDTDANGNAVSYGYMGGIDMMDLNIGDHSSFSKFSLGWIEPTVIYKEQTTITLKPFESSGEAIIIPSSYFNDSAFSEYLILEYKTPTGLNELDYNSQYQGIYPKTFGNGLAIYHVDARIVDIITDNKGDSYIKSYFDANAINFSTTPNDGYIHNYLVSNSNTPSYNLINKNYSLISLLSKNRTLYLAGEQSTISKPANTADLYQEGDVFSSSQIERFFKNDSFNNKTPLNNMTISVDSMTNEGITITINR